MAALLTEVHVSDSDPVFQILGIHETRIQRLEQATTQFAESVGQLNATMKALSDNMKPISDAVGRVSHLEADAKESGKRRDVWVAILVPILASGLTSIVALVIEHLKYHT